MGSSGGECGEVGGSFPLWVRHTSVAFKFAVDSESIYSQGQVAILVVLVSSKVKLT